MLDVEDYDIIVGYRADDSYLTFVRSFINNEISLNQLYQVMGLSKCVEEVVIKSKKAFDDIKFLSYEISDSTIYYAKRKARDLEARDMFNTRVENDDLNGLYMRDIIQEKILPEDKRLLHKRI